MAANACSLPAGSVDPGDPFDLNRFASAQAPVYTDVLAELRNGRKQTHWMWYIFPQIDGLGNSATTKHYAIKSRGEAQAYLQHPVLGARLRECTEIVLRLEGRPISEIFLYPDDLKLRSSMTLFAAITTPDSVFAQLLTKCFAGKPDKRTLEMLESMKS
jgi:uncharacterized protein (DUF1810 family)